MANVGTMKIAFLAALLVSGACLDAPAPLAALQVETRGQQRIPFAGSSAPAVDRAYFTDGNELRWDRRPVSDGVAPCPGGAESSPPPVRRVRLARPRVDERGCQDPGDRRRTVRSLVGFDEQGRLRWERPLAFRSGDVEIQQWLIGAAPEGLVLSNLEVWSPAAGETLLPARTHPAAGRAVPDFNFSNAALYLAVRREILVFDADVTLLRREGGVYRMRMDTGARELWLPVAADALGGFDKVESMAGMDDRFVAIGYRREVRGPSSVSVALYDLATGQVVFKQRLCEDSTCADAQVMAGRDGHFALTYRDEGTREHVMVHYRVVR